MSNKRHPEEMSRNCGRLRFSSVKVCRCDPATYSEAVAASDQVKELANIGQDKSSEAAF